MAKDEGAGFLAAAAAVLVTLVSFEGAGFADAGLGAALGALAGVVLVALAFLEGAGLDSAGEI